MDVERLKILHVTGAYCILFIASGAILYYIRKSRGTNKIIITLSLLLFASCTLHYAEEFNHFYVFLVSSFFYNPLSQFKTRIRGAMAASITTQTKVDKALSQTLLCPSQTFWATSS